MLKKWLKNAISLLLTLFVMSLILDYWRKPQLPVQADTALYDLNQQPFFLAQLSQDQPAVLYFWGSWCHYCQFTSPTINELALEGIPVISVALRSGAEQQVRSYLSENQYQFTTVNDPYGQLSQQWNVQVTPTIIILDQGNIAYATTGLSSYWGIKLRWWLAKWF